MPRLSGGCHPPVQPGDSGFGVDSGRRGRRDRGGDRCARAVDRDLVDHALVRTFYKRAIGTIVIDGPANPELFGVLDAAATTGGETTQPPDQVSVEAEVIIPVGAFDPANADAAYDPLNLTVEVGTTVRWTNLDGGMVHTVTSGTSDGSIGGDDGIFDSGFLNEGDTFVCTFDTPGTFPYFCLPHPWMVGTVTVTG